MTVEWWVVLATLAGPIIAVQTQKWIERASENSKRKLWIFYSLMANRATRLADDYVKALNLIDLEFRPTYWRRENNKKVIAAWRILFGELTHPPEHDAPPVVNVAWNQRCSDRLVDLLSAMSKALGFDHSDEELRRGIYYPQGSYDREIAQQAVVNGIRTILEGGASLPIKMTEAPPNPEAAELQKTLTERMVSAYDKDGALKVRMQQ